MIVAKTIGEVRSAVAATRAGGKTVGFVPTMGALHVGHFSLVDAARAECDFVVVSIFVNPIQFGPREDLSRYPRPIEADLDGCREHGVDLVFLPEPAAMYPPGFATNVHVKGLTEGLCGTSRPGHFDGVCTVVTKLFNIVSADAAYFGAKDYQQAAVVRRMALDLDIPTRVVVCPTVREPDGLAMSSRNAYLSPAERQEALALHEALEHARRLVQSGRRSTAELVAAARQYLANKAPSGTVEYVEVFAAESLEVVEAVTAPAVMALAVRFPSARLIDNMRMD
jgi:pantoate--beta-alanine ligase